MDFDGHALAEEFFHAYLKQVLLDGTFHADPHPGNVFLTTDHKIALIDLGMVGYTTPAMQESLLKFLLAVSEGDSDQAADVAIRISEVASNFRTRRKFRQQSRPTGGRATLQYARPNGYRQGVASKSAAAPPIPAFTCPSN